MSLILVLDLAAVLSAPLLDRAAARWPRAEVWLQDVARWVVFGVVAFHVLPEGWAEAGVLAVLSTIAGFASAILLERTPDGRTSIAATAAAMGVHHLLDGVAIGQRDGEHLGLAVIAHTFPVALLGWRLASRRLGPAAGWVLLVGLCVATVSGYGIGGATLPGAGAGTGVLSCFLGGWLVHALGHRHAPAAEADGPVQVRAAPV